VQAPSRAVAFTSRLPPIGPAGDFHPQSLHHAQRTCRRYAAKISVMYLFRGLSPTAKRCRRCAAIMPALHGIEVRFRSLVLLK
ncbi:MAG: hypothetical protein ABGX16_05535, partial [Pirellulales bacterium]